MKRLLIGLVLLGSTAHAQEAALTCDTAQIDEKSYRLTTRAVALAVLQPRYHWWEAFELGEHEADLMDLNVAVARAAERAERLDSRNAMAHSILARQYLILDDPDRAEPEWRVVLEAGLPVVWTATLYDVDARSYFVMAFDRRGIRVYRFGAVTRELERGFYSIPKFPPEDDERFWAAGGGCLDPRMNMEAEVPWSDVREIKAGNWVLWFKLTRPVTISSDRGKRKELRELKVNLHGRTGELEVYKPAGEEHLAMRGRGPAGYQDLVRRMLVRFVDPEHRIALPPLKPGVGW